MFVFTESWLNDNIPDSAIQLNRLTCHRADRDTTLSGKTRGDGLCVYINKEWCNNAAVVSKHCSPLVEIVCEVLTVLSAAGVHGLCYCRSLHSTVCKR